MEPETLINQLVQAMRQSGFCSEAEELESQALKLSHGNEIEKRSAADFISSHCHVKDYGDLNIAIEGPPYALWNLLSKINESIVHLRA